MKKFVRKFLIFISIVTSLFGTINVLAKEQLLFAVDLIRHGDRIPVFAIPKSPYHWSEGYGELTPEGMNQEFQLGVQLRKKYIDKYHLLPAHYRSETMYVRSTDVNRTLMSAESCLMGLYPLGTGPQLNSNTPALPAAFQPIPVHTVPLDQDHLLTWKASKNVLLIMKNHKAWQEKMASLQDQFAKWSQATGMKIENLGQLELLGDNFYIRKLHHIPLPAGMSSQDAAQIISAGQWVLVNKVKSEKIASPVGHEILKTVMNYFQRTTEQPLTLKYVLFSAHDVTIMAVMNTLGAPMNEPPTYASHLNFALFENDKKYSIKVSLNDQPVNIPVCHGSVCSLEQFSKLAE